MADKNKNRTRKSEKATQERPLLRVTLGLLCLSKGIERIGEFEIERHEPVKIEKVGPQGVGTVIGALKAAYRKHVKGIKASGGIEQSVAAAYEAYCSEKQKPLPRERWEATKAGQAAIATAQPVEVPSFRAWYAALDPDQRIAIVRSTCVERIIARKGGNLNWLGFPPKAYYEYVEEMDEHNALLAAKGLAEEPVLEWKDWRLTLASSTDIAREAADPLARVLTHSGRTIDAKARAEKRAKWQAAGSKKRTQAQAAKAAAEAAKRAAKAGGENRDAAKKEGKAVAA